MTGTARHLCDLAPLRLCSGHALREILRNSVAAVRQQANLFFPASSGIKPVLLSVIICAAWQIFQCANSKRAGFKPAPTMPNSFLCPLRPLRLNTPNPCVYIGCGCAALGLTPLTGPSQANNPKRRPTQYPSGAIRLKHRYSRRLTPEIPNAYAQPPSPFRSCSIFARIASDFGSQASAGICR